jgi:hypothetical protein
MPNVAARRRQPRGRHRQAAQPRLALVPAPAAIPPEEKPVRGVKLKTVSTCTLVFALLCVAAFAAGRPPAPAMDTAAGHETKGAAHVPRTANRTSAVNSTRLGR